MILGIHVFSLNTLPHPPKFQTHSSPITTIFSCRPKPQIPCINSNISGAELASDLATEVAKMNTHLVQREEAMKKSRELLFAHLCQYLALKEEELKKNWREIAEEERWVLIKGFVSELGVNFHPLSARYVKEMVDEYLDEGEPSSNSSTSVLFPRLRRIMGFSQNQ